MISFSYQEEGKDALCGQVEGCNVMQWEGRRQNWGPEKNVAELEMWVLSEMHCQNKMTEDIVSWNLEPEKDTLGGWRDED